MSQSKKPKKSARPKGRPTKFEEHYIRQAQKLARFGATDLEMADFFGVSRSTLELWKKNNKDFSDTIKRAKLSADIDVSESLFKRATGFHMNDVKTMKPTLKAGYIYYPPDTTAAIFWLKNRQKEKWRDKQEFGIELEQLSDEQLDRLFEKVLSKININEKGR